MTQNKALVIKNDMGLKDIGEVLARSGFFTDSRDAAQAVVKVLAGAELGLGPVASMTGIYIVKGRVTLSANLIAGAIKRSGKYNFRVTEHTDKSCTIDFYEGDAKIGTSSFSMDDARKAQLGGDNWNKYPRNMLYARAMSNGAKWYCPDVFAGGVYTPDELGEVVDGETGEVIDNEPKAETVKAVPPAEKVNGNGHTPEPSLVEMLERYSKAEEKAVALGIQIVPLPNEPTVEIIRERGNRLNELIKSRKAEKAQAAV